MQGLGTIVPHKKYASKTAAKRGWKRICFANQLFKQGMNMNKVLSGQPLFMPS